VTTQTAASTNLPKLLRANEVANRLNISRSLAYQLLQRGEIPTVRFGSSVRVRECDLDEYLTRHWSGWNVE